MLLQLSHFVSPLSPPPCTPPPAFPRPQFTSMGRTYKFFGFSIYYIILNLPLSVLYLLFMDLIPCTFSPFSPLPILTDNPPCYFHFCDSVPVLVVCFVCFWFWILGSVVDSCEFVVILLFVFLIFFSQISPFNISFNKGLVTMHSFNLTLSEKHFSCPSILKDSFAGQSHLGCRSLPFVTWNTSFQPLLMCQVSFEKSADSLMGTPLQATVSFSLAAFKIFLLPRWLQLSGLSAGLQTERSQVQFLVRAHAWVVGQVPCGWCARGNHTVMLLSLSFSLPSPLSKNK